MLPNAASGKSPYSTSPTDRARLPLSARNFQHQLFSFISINWRGKPLICYEFMLELIRHTTTKAGLRVHAILDPQPYPTGIKISDKEMMQLNIEGDEFHPDWNYTIRPQLI